MKKTYQNPATKIVIINTSCLMLNGSEEVSVQGEFDSETVEMSTRRRNSLWDED